MSIVKSEPTKGKQHYRESSTTHYFLNSNDVNKKEIVIVKLDEGDILSITFMQGDLDIQRLQYYLSFIRSSLGIMGL